MSKEDNTLNELLSDAGKLTEVIVSKFPNDCVAGEKSVDVAIRLLDELIEFRERRM